MIRIGHATSRRRIQHAADLSSFTFEEPRTDRGRLIRASTRQSVAEALVHPGAPELLDWSHLGSFTFETLARRRISKMTRAKARSRWNLLVVVGNRDGVFGVGLGSAIDMKLAHASACRNALLNMTCSDLVLGGKRELRQAKVNATRVVVSPRPVGAGVVANKILRQMAVLTGIKDVTIKVYKSSHPINMVKAFCRAISNE